MSRSALQAVEPTTVLDLDGRQREEVVAEIAHLKSGVLGNADEGNLKA